MMRPASAASTAIATRSVTFLLCSLLALSTLAACGVPSTTRLQSSISNIPVGTGNNPEQGNSGKPAPNPTGHNESITTGGNVAYVGSDNGRAYAFNATTGKVLWQHLLGGTVILYTVSSGVVYASAQPGSGATSSSGYIGGVYALSAATGKVLWQFHQTTVDIVTVVASGSLVVADTAADGNQSTVIALSSAGGHLLWQRTVTSYFPVLLGISNGIVYTRQQASVGNPGAASTFSALDLTTGNPLWQLTISGTDGVAGGLPIESNGILYLETGNGGLYALQATGGAILWHIAGSFRPGPPVSPIYLEPILANGLLYAGGSEAVTAYRPSDGSVVWRYRNTITGPIFGPFLPQPVLVSGVLYVAMASDVIALRAVDGSLLWQVRAEGASEGPMLVGNGVLISNGQTVYALRMSDGSKVWQAPYVQTGGRIIGPVGNAEAIGTGGTGYVVYLGSDDGIVHALDAATSHQLWQYVITELAVPQLPVFSAAVAFTSSTTYAQALAQVTNLGLKTFLPCTSGWTSQASIQKSFPGGGMTVEATEASAPLWYVRLQALPDVASTQPNPIWNCPLEQPSTGPQYLGQQSRTPYPPPAYLQVTFSSAAAYNTALAAVDGLGFRLAAPCYEERRAQGAKPTWQPLSQEVSYNRGRSLVLATTGENSTIWLQQIHAFPGVRAVTTPFTASC
jgi:outer membrane protein assembly factor BamB